MSIFAGSTRSHLVAFAAAASLVAAPLAFADELETEQSGEPAAIDTPSSDEAVSTDAPANADGDPVDEITVTGQGNRNYFKRQMIQAETEFYDLFNELTSEEDFKIICETKERHAFTRVKVRKCESLYESKIAYELTQRAFDLSSRAGANVEVPATKRGEYEQRVAERRQEQLADMARILEENPEFQQKLISLNKAKADYEESKSK